MNIYIICTVYKHVVQNMVIYYSIDYIHTSMGILLFLNNSSKRSPVVAMVKSRAFVAVFTESINFMKDLQ